MGDPRDHGRAVKAEDLDLLPKGVVGSNPAGHLLNQFRALWCNGIAYGFASETRVRFPARSFFLAPFPLLFRKEEKRKGPREIRTLGQSFEETALPLSYKGWVS